METKYIEKILEIQDKIVYFRVNSLTENMVSEKIESINMSYREAEEFIKNNDEILSKISTENLITIFSNLQGNGKIKNNIEIMLMKRFENGENLFGGNNFEISFMGINMYAWDRAFSKLSKENQDIIKKAILEKFENLKQNDPLCYGIIKESNSIFEVSNFMKYYENNVFDNKKIQTLKEICSYEKDIIKRINFALFEDDIFNLGENFVKHVAKYPNLSAKLIMINRNNKKLFEILSNEINNIEKVVSRSQFYEEIERLINYCSRHYDEIKEIDDPKSFINYTIQQGKKIVKTDKISLKWQDNYDFEFDKLCDEKFQDTIQEEEQIKKSYHEEMKEFAEIKYKNLKRDKLNIILNKYFSLSYEEATELLDSYTKDLKNIAKYDSNGKTIEFLEELIKIYNVDEINELNNLYNTYSKKANGKQILTMESDLRKLYALSYVDRLQQMEANIDYLKKNNSNKVKEINYNNKIITVVKVNGNFNLLVHSSDTGFKGNKELINNSYKDTWDNIQDASNHLIAASYINQDFLGSAPVGENGVLYGFTNVPADYINLMGNSDINSHVRSSNYASGRSLYMSSYEMPYTSRRVYNEIAIERENTKPDYVVVYDDMEDKQRKNAYDSAVEFDIPIIYINKKEIADQQIQNINILMETFKSTNTVEILEELVNVYETNKAGWLLNRKKDISDESFTKQIQNNEFEDMFNNIGKQINNIILEYKENLLKLNDKIGLDKLNRIIEKEKRLYERQNEQATPISKTEISEYISKINISHMRDTK